MYAGLDVRAGAADRPPRRRAREEPTARPSRRTRRGREMRQHDTFETELIDALQPVRAFALATAIWHLFETGLFEALEPGGRPLRALAGEKDLDEVRLEAFLKYLRNEGLVSEREGGYGLTAKGKALAPFRG